MSLDVHLPVLPQRLMNSLQDISRVCETIMPTPATSHQIWWSYVPEPGQLPLQQVYYSEPLWPSLQSNAQAQRTGDVHRRDLRVGIMPSNDGFYPMERNSVHPSAPTRRPVEEPPSAMLQGSNSFGPLDHSRRLTTTSPVLSNASGVNLPTSAICISAKQMPFDWSTSEAMANSAGIHLEQTTFDLDGTVRYDRSHKARRHPMQREDDHLSFALFDLPQACTPGPSSPVTKKGLSTRIVKSDSRHICNICFKSHARPSRKMACENGHLGYQPFVCDGTCGDPGCRASFANKEHLRTHKQPYSKTHVSCPICGKHGWRRNAERHLRSCLNRHKPESNNQD